MKGLHNRSRSFGLRALQREAGLAAPATIVAVVAFAAAIIGIAAGLVEIISYLSEDPSPPPTAAAPSSPPSPSVPPSPAVTVEPPPTDPPSSPTPEPEPGWDTLGRSALISGRGFEVMPEVGVGAAQRTAFVCDRCPRQLCGWGCTPYGEDYSEVIFRLPLGTRSVLVKAGLDSFHTATETPLQVTVWLDGQVVEKEVVGPSRPLTVSVTQRRPMARLFVRWMGVEGKHVLMITRPHVTTDAP